MHLHRISIPFLSQHSILLQLMLMWYTFSDVLILQANGHGSMIEPPSRNYMWKVGFANPANFNHDELFCGGITKQWSDNDGKCGVCGDAYDEPTPRPHEMGGFFGNGIIARTYHPGEIINVTVVLSTNHQGWMEWRICPYRDAKKEVTQKCLDDGLMNFADTYETRYNIPEKARSHNFTVNVRLKLPERFVCKQCVIQWHYYTGNFWNICENGTGALGCGQQETYRNCADVSIGYYQAQTSWYSHLNNPLSYFRAHQQPQAHN